MTFGFNMHIVCGRIASIQSLETNGTPLVNVRLQVRNGPKREGPPLWIEASIWGRYALIFNDCGFRKGDKLSVCLSSLEQRLWQDKEGEFHASLKGSVDRFWDLRSGPQESPRPGALPPAGPKAEEPEPPGESPGPRPKP
jgi:single-stranded DNA-binding protein